MLSAYSLVILAALVFNCNGEDGYLPSYVKPCSFQDKSFENCVKDQMENIIPSFSKGIPELGVPSIDPINLEDLIIDASGLKLTFKEAAMHGLSGSKITNLKVTIGKVDEAFSLTFKCNLSLTAKYEADGRILILPIQGKGDAFIYAQGAEVKIDSKLIHVKDSKGEHLKLTIPTYKYTIERTTFDLKNLFNGNKQLAETTLQFANENWQQLMDELAPPAIKQIVRSCVKAINKFFSNVTIQQIIRGYEGRP